MNSSTSVIRQYSSSPEYSNSINIHIKILYDQLVEFLVDIGEHLVILCCIDIT